MTMLRWTNEQHEEWKKKRAKQCADIDQLEREVDQLGDQFEGVARTPIVAPQMTLLELRRLAFTLPQPCSVNEIYRTNLHTGAKYLTEAQKQFRSAVISIVRGEMRRLEQRDQPLLGTIEARVVVSDRLDVDNGLKSLLDALQHAKAYHNDRQIRRLLVEVVSMPRDRERCEVVLQEIAA